MQSGGLVKEEIVKRARVVNYTPFENTQRETKFHMTNKKVITVFGSSACRPGDEDYALAERLGGALARAGYIVCNGGYMGTMEASAKGAKEAGGEAIGITVETFTNRTANPFLTQEHRQPDLHSRIEKLISLADAYVILPGGIGTLAELFVVWNLVVMKNIPPRPILLLGNLYDQLLRTLQELTEVEQNHLAFLKVVYSVEEIVENLKEHLRKQ